MRWLHLSDIHFCPEMDGREARQLKDQLPEYIADNINRVDHVFLTGDYRDASKKDDIITEVKAAAKFIKEIANSVGVTDAKNIHLVLVRRCP